MVPSVVPSVIWSVGCVAKPPRKDTCFVCRDDLGRQRDGRQRDDRQRDDRQQDDRQRGVWDVAGPRPGCVASVASVHWFGQVRQEHQG